MPSSLKDFAEFDRLLAETQLNFGLIASRELDTYPAADDLYKLASFVIYWGET